MVEASRQVGDVTVFKATAETMTGIITAVVDITKVMGDIIDDIKPGLFEFTNRSEKMRDNINSLKGFMESMIGDSGSGLVGMLSTIRTFITNVSEGDVAEQNGRFVSLMTNTLTAVTSMITALKPSDAFMSAVTSTLSLDSASDINEGLNSLAVYIENLSHSLTGPKGPLNNIKNFLSSLSSIGTDVISESSLKIVKGVGDFLSFIGPLVKSLQPPKSFFEATGGLFDDDLEDALDGYTKYFTRILPMLSSVVESAAVPIQELTTSLMKGLSGVIFGVDKEQLRGMSDMFGSVLGPTIGMIGKLLKFQVETSKDRRLWESQGAGADAFSKLANVISGMGGDIATFARSIIAVAQDVAVGSNVSSVKSGVSIIGSTIDVLMKFTETFGNMLTLDTKLSKVPRFAKVEEAASAPLVPVWEIPFAPGRHGKRFVDLQDDVTSEDVRLANREGYVSVEHLKRYTTLGMGTDQGRTSNVNGLAIMSSLLGKSVPEVGHTTFRAPFSPVTMGAIAAAEHGRHVAPIRRTPMYDWHRRAGAPFVTAGPWLRAQYYPRPGETMMQSIWREAKHVRNHVGIVDVSPLGKIEVQGRDAAEFLERVYINRWKKLAVGRARYGLMLREDGVVLDDGTTTRIAENEFYMTTTTAKAGQVMAQLEFYAQTVWPQLHVHLTSITDQWGGLALAGPHARTVLKTAVGDSCDVSNEALPFMGYAEAEIAGCPVRLFRITFSGELAYEIHMPADFGETVWQAVIDAGEPHDIIPYGTEAMSILRIEKGHLVGGELDGRSYPAEFGFGRMLKPDGDYIGKRSLEREALAGGTGRRFVGLVSENGKHIPRGAQLVWNPTAPKPVQMLGHVTSTCYSPNLDREIALAMLRDGDHRMGESLYASSPVQGQHVPVKVVEPVFIDPQGERPRA